MRSLVLALATAALLPAVVVAQRATEWQVYGVGTVTGATFRGGGVGIGMRSGGRLRVAAAVAAGATSGEAAGRGEVLVSYHANPIKRRGVAPYVAGGLAVTATGQAATEFIVITIGLEARPGRRSGWFIEGGLSGGVRIAAGWRIRVFRRRP